MACVDILMRKLPSGGHRILWWLTKPSPPYDDLPLEDRPNYDAKTGWYGVNRIGDLWMPRRERR